MEDGGGGDVDALGDLGVFVAEQLQPQQPTGEPVTGDPHGDAVAAGVVGLVVIGLGANSDRVEAGRGGFVVAQAGAGGGLVEDLDDLGAQAAGEGPVPAERVLPGDPALLVRGGAQRQIRHPEQPVVRDHAVPGGEHVRQIGPHAGVDRDRAPDAELGPDPASGLAVSLKKGPYGHYIQLGAGDNGDKPKRVALPKGLEPAGVNLDIAIKLLSLPREIGRDPDSGETIVAGVGRFGPYIKRGTIFASLGADDDVLNIGLNRAVTVLAEAQNKAGGRRGPQLLRDLGAHPEGGTVGLYRGRYGPYVSHAGLFASLPKAADPDNFALAEALPLLAAQKAKGKTPRKPRPAAAAEANGARGSAKKPVRKVSGRTKATPGKSPGKSRRASSSRPATP